jgi:hypothetical protein
MFGDARFVYGSIFLAVALAFLVIMGMFHPFMTRPWTRIYIAFAAVCAFGTFVAYAAAFIEN